MNIPTRFVVVAFFLCIKFKDNTVIKNKKMDLNLENVSRVQFIELSNPIRLSSSTFYDVEIKDTFYDLEKALTSFLPTEAISEVVAMLKKHNILLHIETPRKESLGICYAYQKKICVNNNLNKDRFLSVFIHEYAHLLTDLSFPKSACHGIEFYYCFQELVLVFIDKKIIPKDMFLPIVNRTGDYEFFKKYNRFIFELRTIRVGRQAIYKEKIIIRGKGHQGMIHCIRVSDNAKIQLKPHSKVLPVLDLEF